MSMPHSLRNCTPVVIESVDYEGRGIARVNGKVVFIEGAITGEKVGYTSNRCKGTYEIATLEHVYQESNMRVQPRCCYFDFCGGCSLQHIEARAQSAIKQRVLEDALGHIGKIEAETILPAIAGPTWGYRYRARLSVHYLAEKNSVVIGFRQKKSSYVADISSCEILPKTVSNLLIPLRELISQLSISHRIPQIELAIGEWQNQTNSGLVQKYLKNSIIFVLRILQPLHAMDLEKLAAFAEQYQIHWYIQPRGPESAYPLSPLPEKLAYILHDFNITIYFEPTDFTQVNHMVNQSLVRQAVRLIDPKPNEQIVDFFCGLGNFTLPIARSGAFVYGVEGNANLVARAQQNAKINGLAERTKFWTQDLFETTVEHGKSWAKFDKLLLDPPREGAIAVVKALPKNGLHRIVYVSCNPATLARDAAVLVQTQGYRLRAAGIINMFPHTAHVESIALFERQ